MTSQIEQLIDRALALSGDELVELTEEICCEAEAGQTGPILKARCIPYIDRAGRNVGTITVLHDITTLKRMDQIKSEFVSMVSHEIRSPLNSVLAQMQIILDGLAGEVTPRQQEILGRASAKVKSLVSLSSELLDLARIESGLISQEMEQLNLGDILADQVAFHGAAAQAKGISLAWSLSPSLPRVCGPAQYGGGVFQSHQQRHQLYARRWESGRCRRHGGRLPQGQRVR